MNGQMPVCCGLSLDPTVLTAKVPVPEMAVGVAQLSEPWACARAPRSAQPRSARERVESRFMRMCRGRGPVRGIDRTLPHATRARLPDLGVRSRNREKLLFQALRAAQRRAAEPHQAAEH